MHSQRGFLSLIAVIIIVVIGLLGVTAAYLFTVHSALYSNGVAGEKAFYLAEAGLSRGMYAVSTPTLSGSATRVTCDGLSITDNATLNPPGQYSVAQLGTVSYPSTATSLTSALTATSGTISVGSTANYASAGFIRIDHEEIRYSDTTSTSFINVQRGYNGTTAVAHASGTDVAQYQCNLQAQGGVPTLASSTGKHTIQGAIGLEDGFAVGPISIVSQLNIYRWNYPNEIAWNNASFLQLLAPQLNSVAVLSSADAWAVGNVLSLNAYILHWDGSSWSRVLPAAILNLNLNSVSCSASNNCWAVGGTNVFLRYNGSTWSSSTASALTSGTYNSISCPASNFCMVVGVSRRVGIWNGTTWSVVSTTSLPNVTYNEVYCNSSTDCWIVGDRGSGNDTLVRWNGSSLALSTVSGTQIDLNSVVCTASNDCWAVGDASGNNTMLVRWNGSSWTNTSVNTGGKNGLSIDCINSRNCWFGAQTGTLGHWNGNSWVTTTVGNRDFNGIGLVGSPNPGYAYWRD